MDMGEFDARFAETNAKIDTRFAEQKFCMDTRFAETHTLMREMFAEHRAETRSGFADHRAEMSERFGQFEAKMQKQVGDLIKWIVGTGIAVIAIIVAILTLTVNLLARGAPEAYLTGSSVTTSPDSDVAIRVGTNCTPA